MGYSRFPFGNRRSGYIKAGGQLFLGKSAVTAQFLQFFMKFHRDRILSKYKGIVSKQSVNCNRACTTAPYVNRRELDEILDYVDKGGTTEEWNKLKQKGAKFTLDKTPKSGILKLADIVIAKSVGAKSKNYEVMDLATGEMFNFVEGTKIQNVEVFAGKGSKTPYRKAYVYANAHGGKEEDWQHVKGFGWLETPEGDMRAEVHWSQCEGIGKYDFFVKRWLDE